jgi:hypothetical protein
LHNAPVVVRGYRAGRDKLPSDLGSVPLELPLQTVKGCSV